MTYILDFPAELITETLGNLSPAEVAQFRRTCRHFKHFVNVNIASITRKIATNSGIQPLIVGDRGEAARIFDPFSEAGHCGGPCHTFLEIVRSACALYGVPAMEPEASCEMFGPRWLDHVNVPKIKSTIQATANVVRVLVSGHHSHEQQKSHDGSQAVPSPSIHAELESWIDQYNRSVAPYARYLRDCPITIYTSEIVDFESDVAARGLSASPANTEARLCQIPFRRPEFWNARFSDQWRSHEVFGDVSVKHVHAYFGNTKELDYIFDEGKRFWSRDVKVVATTKWALKTMSRDGFGNDKFDPLFALELRGSWFVFEGRGDGEEEDPSTSRSRKDAAFTDKMFQRIGVSGEISCAFLRCFW